MKFCYIDESGTGEEPYAVMVGVITDAQRMYKTKEEWAKALDALKKVANKPITEFHAKDFYRGRGPWYGVNGEVRAEVIGIILRWLKQRRHKIVYSAVDKNKFSSEYYQEIFFKDLSSLWCFLAIHICLAIQKCHQAERKPKGHTVLIFDNKECEEERLVKLIKKPPNWTDSYYNRDEKQSCFNQIIDVPYFVDSKYVISIQIADLLAYLLRKNIEFKMKVATEKYEGEKEQIEGWVYNILQLSMPRSMIYLSKGRCPCSELFYKYAPPCILELQ